jgi:hypothetical protein
MTTLIQNQPHTNLLARDHSLTVTAPPAGVAFVALSRGGSVVQNTQLSNGQSLTFGPYNLDVQVKVTSNAVGATVQDQEALQQVAASSYAAADQTKQLINTAVAAATVGINVTDVILDGVSTTFALTFPAPQGDKQVLKVLAATAISAAFSAVVTAPATAIKTVPATLPIGGIAWEDNASNNTWYRLY